jgi:hypothetical protein
MSYHDFDVSYVLMRNKLGKIIALYVGPHHKRSKTHSSFEKNECESDCITFVDNSQGQVLGFGKISITTKHSISNVLIESLDYNLLSISQLCEMGYNCLFTDKSVTIFRRSDGSFAFKGVLTGKLYLVDFNPEEVELDRWLIAKQTWVGCGIEG